MLRRHTHHFRTAKRWRKDAVGPQNLRGGRRVRRVCPGGFVRPGGPIHVRPPAGHILKHAVFSPEVRRVWG